MLVLEKGLEVVSTGTLYRPGEAFDATIKAPYPFAVLDEEVRQLSRNVGSCFILEAFEFDRGRNELTLHFTPAKVLSYVVRRRPAWWRRLLAAAGRWVGLGVLVLLLCLAVAGFAPAPAEKRPPRPGERVVVLHYKGDDWTLTLHPDGRSVAVKAGLPVWRGTWRRVGPDLVRVEEEQEGRPELRLSWVARTDGREAWLVEGE